MVMPKARRSNLGGAVVRCNQINGRGGGGGRRTEWRDGSTVQANQPGRGWGRGRRRGGGDGGKKPRAFRTPGVTCFDCCNYACQPSSTVQKAVTLMGMVYTQAPCDREEAKKSGRKRPSAAPSPHSVGTHISLSTPKVYWWVSGCKDVRRRCFHPVTDSKFAWTCLDQHPIIRFQCETLGLTALTAHVFPCMTYLLRYLGGWVGGWVGE